MYRYDSLGACISGSVGASYVGAGVRMKIPGTVVFSTAYTTSPPT